MHEKHILVAFDRDLENIQTALMRMGDLVEDALRNASMALEARDVDLAGKVRVWDRTIDSLGQQIKADLVKLLALRSPTAVDLRAVLSVMEISSHLERFDDYAKNMAKRTLAMAQDGEIDGTIAALRRMSRFVETMIKGALDANATQDSTKAEDVIERDQEADEIYNMLFRTLLTHMMEDHRKIAVGMHLRFHRRKHRTRRRSRDRYCRTNNLSGEGCPAPGRSPQMGRHIDGIS